MCKRISNKDTLSDQHEESNPAETAHTGNNTEYSCDIFADQFMVAVLILNDRFCNGPCVNPLFSSFDPVAEILLPSVISMVLSPDGIR